MSVGQFFFYAGAVLLVIFTVVLVHESGHFILAKLSGVKVDEFAIGFGPRLVARTWGDTVYAIRAIPAGGFVRMAGMLGIEGESDAGERNFYRAPIPKRALTIFAGVAFNFVFGALCIGAVNMQPTPSHVLADSPAQKAGLHDGAVILNVDGMSIRHDTQQNVSADLHAVTTASRGAALTVTYRAADGAVHATVVKPELVLINLDSSSSLPTGNLIITSVAGRKVPTGDPATLLDGAQVAGFQENTDGSPGRFFGPVTVQGVKDGYGASGAMEAAWLIGISAGADGKALLPAIGDGFAFIPTFISTTVTGIYHIATTPSTGGLNGPQGLAGPVGIAQATVTAAQSGGAVFLYWIGFVSINLGFINLLPIPFLDGGKLLFLGIEAVRRRRLDPRHEAMAYAISLALVVLFAVYVTIGDVSRL